MLISAVVVAFTFWCLPTASQANASANVAQPRLPTIALILQVGMMAHRYQVEVARTADQQAMGMMFRRSMERNRGMIFPFEAARELTFWMENTVLPLDLIFIGADHRVLRIARDAKPFSRELISSGGAANAVLELNAGEAARIGLKPGDRVEYTQTQ
jgi:hypothetical protein